MRPLAEFWRDEDGQDMVEYSLLIAFIALSVAALLNGIGGNISALWLSINSKVSSAATTAGS